MANNIALAQKYLPLLDEVYNAESKTSMLDNPTAVFTGANEVKYYKMDMDGLGNYSRSEGFATGDVTGTWETMKLTQDRGRTFTVDAMDNEETVGLAFGRLASEFLKTKVIPEIDAYTFAKLAGTTGISSATPADVVVGTSDIPVFIEEAERQMNEDEVPETGRQLFISETAYSGLKAKVVRSVANDITGINRMVETYDEMEITRVPQSRFYTGIAIRDGKTEGQKQGGYAPASGAYKINFMIIHPSAVNKVVKHALPRIFDPNTNQSADAWKFDYRIYHDCFVYDNKVKGVYLHRGSTAV